MKEHRFVGAFAAVILTLCVAGIARAGVTYTQSGWQLVNSSGTTNQPSYAACVTALKAQPLPARQRTDYCREKWVTRVTADPPPPTCTAPKPADETRAQTCPTGTTGTWSQSRSYSSAAYPTCWTPGDWSPSSPPAGACVTPPPQDPPPTAGIVYQSPPIADATVLKDGETLRLKPGVYTALKLKAFPASAWGVIAADVDGTVTLPALDLSAGADWHLQLEGLKFKGKGSVVIGSNVRLLRNAFEGGPATGNAVSLQLGTNDRTPGCSNIEIEDSWVYGLGGRYKVLVYNCDTVKLTRVVARHDGGWAYDGQNPQGGITVYDSKNVALENVACVDSVQGLSGFESCIYLVSNGTTATKQANVTVNGAIIIDSPNNGLGAEGRGSAATYAVNNLLVVNSAAGGINTNNSAHVVNATRVTCSVKGVCFGKWSSGGAIRVTGCKVGKGTLSSGATLSSCPGGTGADFAGILPWPNEARMKADFDSVRPAFGGRSFSEYVKAAQQ